MRSPLASLRFSAQFSAVSGKLLTRSAVVRPRSSIAVGWPLVLSLSFAVVAGCSPLDLALGGGATAGVAASEERGIDGTLNDTTISTRISAELAHKDSNIFIALTISVYEGRVLLTGILKRQEDVDFAVKTAWGVDGVREVINEIVLDPTGRTGTFASDSLIVAQIKTDLLLDKNVSARSEEHTSELQSH